MRKKGTIGNNNKKEHCVFSAVLATLVLLVMVGGLGYAALAVSTNKVSKKTV